MAFPTSPSDGDEYTTILGTVYKYRDSDDCWYIINGVVNHNDLPDLNDGTDYEHITQTQKDVLHAIVVAGDLNLNDLAEKNHISLANKNAEANVQHLTSAQVAALHTRSHTITGTSDHTANNWKIVYTNGSGQVIELALGVSGKILQSNGASSAPTFETPAGGITYTSLDNGVDYVQTEAGGGPFEDIADDTNWHELDISAVVPVDCVLVNLNLTMRDGTIGSCQWRMKGEVDVGIVSRMQVVNIYHSPAFVLGVVDQTIEWKMNPKPSSWTQFYCDIVGYWS